ncbi:TetR/AcrR family transcriptional regulator C-terminal domain-containing protein [Hamadaea sp. NPDC051192]|uniref:TetR/AcrR family transcriptional regulator C-terminal domain-containing protein n=1 Tax=Hamadaea sp. NPDC051192 TaxID=3154940 RepID=UPI00342CE7E8
MSVPPYQRIADQIRHRISTGELQPGHRVPSARTITREWGVALATATKVLAVLQQDGVVTVVPGIGTIVAEPDAPAANNARPTEGPSNGTAARAPARRAEGELTRDKIIRKAVEIADAEGMNEVSMRRIAAELGAATMSLYRYVPSKDDLIIHMIDLAMGEENFPPERPAGWRAQLEFAARLQWRLFHRHPWLAPVLSLTRPQLAPNALQHTEWILGAFDDENLDMLTRMLVHITMFSFVRGIATAFEPEQEAQRETGLTEDEWMQTQEQAFYDFVSAGHLKRFFEFSKTVEFDFDLDKLFEFGLGRMLDGLAAFLEHGKP